AARTTGSMAHTPIDMSIYADAARGAAASAEAAAQSRLSIARRPAVDLPLAVGAPFTSAGVSGPIASAEPPVEVKTVAADQALDLDLDLGSRFDVPAFLRRQDG